LFTGTTRYCSLNAHNCWQQSRRDDLEAIGNVLVYLAKGSLPWMSAEANRRNVEKESLKIKESTTIEELCKGLPSFMSEFMNYIKRLEFTAKPDYDYCTNLFDSYFKLMKYELDYEFDW